MHMLFDITNSKGLPQELPAEVGINEGYRR